MNLHRFIRNVGALVIGIALMLIVSVARGESPAAAPAPDGSEVKKAVTGAAPRVQPQVIYRLPKSSQDAAAALHSQAKAENTMLPIDSSMPTSLQLARSNANAAAAAAQTPSPASSPQLQLQDTGVRKQHSNSVTARPKSARPRTAAARNSAKAPPGKEAKGRHKH
jgi:hypothetical protein